MKHRTYQHSSADAGDGRVSTEFTFWCGLCSHWLQLSSEGSVTRTGRVASETYGWRKTRKHGWVCRGHKERS